MLTDLRAEPAYEAARPLLGSEVERAAASATRYLADDCTGQVDPSDQRAGACTDHYLVFGFNLSATEIMLRSS